MTASRAFSTRLRCAALLVCLLGPCAVVRAQSPVRREEARDVSVAFVGVQVTEALEQLASLSGMSLVWGGDLAQRADSLRGTPVRVSCRLQNASAERVLDCITREAGLDWYRLSTGTYVVVERSERPAAFCTLSGVVLDAATLAPVPAAHVRLVESAAPRMAGASGEFAFERLLPGRYVVQVQAIGYRPWRGQIDLAPAGRERRRVVLERVEALPTPIIINGTAPRERSAMLGAEALTDSAAARWMRAPSFFFPGAPALLGMSRRDGTGDLHLQGGEVGELPWRLDGVPLYDASMLSGLLGSVAAPAIEQVTVHRAGFGAREGSFTAGVIDLSHALGADGRTRPSSVVEADPLAVAARVTVPASIGDVRLRAMIAGRRGLGDWARPTAMTRAFREWNAPDPLLMERLSGTPAADRASLRVADAETQVTVQEYHAGVRAEFGDFQRLDLSAFGGRHGIATEAFARDTTGSGVQSRDAYAWDTRALQLRHSMLLGARVTQSIQLRGLQHDLDHDGWLRMSSGVSGAMMGAEGNRLREVALNAEWSRAGSVNWELHWGGDATRTSAHMRLANTVLRPLDATMEATRTTVWGDASRRVGAQRWLDMGLRVTALGATGRYAEPRVALRADGETRALGPYAWRLAVGGYHQFVNQFDVATTMPVALVPSLRFWLPASASTGVPQAWHAAFEGSARPWAGWELRGELYGKWQPTLLAFDYGALFDSATVATPLTADRYVQTARGYAAGAGVRAMRSARLGTWPLRVALSADAGLVRRTSPSRFRGTFQPTPWLEPLRTLVNVEVEPQRGLVLAVRARGVFGRSWALRQTYYDLFGASQSGTDLALDDPGSMSRPAILDADLGATWTRVVGTTPVTVGASLQNVFNRRNVLDYSLQRATANASTLQMVPRHLPGRQLSLTLRVTP